MPRQVRNGEPKIVAVGGGTPRKVHSRPKGGDGARMGQEESRFLPDAREQLIQIVGGRRTLARRDLECRIDIIEQAIVGVVDQLALLALFDLFHGQPQLLPDLVVRMTKEIRDAGVNIHHGRDRTQRIFTRSLHIVDKGLGQCTFIARSAGDFDVRIVLDLVDSVGTRFDRNPAEQLHQPARSNGRQAGAASWLC